MSTFTLNSALEVSETGSKNLDFFSKAGALRSMPEAEIISLWFSAFDEDPILATKSLFYSRDIRGGQGQRQPFRVILKSLAKREPALCNRLIPIVSEYGRFDDLFCLANTQCCDDMIEYMSTTLQKDYSLISDPKAKISLAAKWAPSEKSTENGRVFRRLVRKMELSKKEYRHMISALRRHLNVVEVKMCANEWDSISFDKVTSHAIKIYRNSFSNHTPELWSAFIKLLESGESKVNASALYPHDIISSYGNTNTLDRLLEAQWKSLPNFMEGSNEVVMPICDVSGSMNGTPINVCIALGIYISERNVGPFKDAFITFSDNPTMQHLTGETLLSKRLQLSTADWGMATNIERTFKVMLDGIKKYELPKEQIPTCVIVLSDMQFNQATRADQTTFENIKDMYDEAEVAVPKIVFWNLAASSSGSPVSMHESGTVLVSGFSPSIMKSLLNGSSNFTPYTMMLEAINVDRYNVIEGIVNTPSGDE